MTIWEAFRYAIQYTQVSTAAKTVPAIRNLILNLGRRNLYRRDAFEKIYGYWGSRIRDCTLAKILNQNCAALLHFFNTCRFVQWPKHDVLIRYFISDRYYQYRYYLYRVPNNVNCVTKSLFRTSRVLNINGGTSSSFSRNFTLCGNSLYPGTIIQYI